MIYHSNIKEIASLLLKKDLQNALNNLFFEVQEKFHSSKKANNICADREKVAEKHIGELSSTSAQNETNNIGEMAPQKLTVLTRIYITKII